MTKAKIYIEAELSLTQEDFFLFKALSEKLKLSVGDVIISSARYRAKEILGSTHKTNETKDNSSNTGTA